MSRPTTIAPQSLLVASDVSERRLEAYLDIRGLFGHCDRRVLVGGRPDVMRRDRDQGIARREIKLTAKLGYELATNKQARQHWRLERIVQSLDVLLIQLNPSDIKSRDWNGQDNGQAWESLGRSLATKFKTLLLACESSAADVLHRQYKLGGSSRMSGPMIVFCLPDQPKYAFKESQNLNAIVRLVEFSNAVAQTLSRDSNSAEKYLLATVDDLKPNSRIQNDWENTIGDKSRMLRQRLLTCRQFLAALVLDSDAAVLTNRSPQQKTRPWFERSLLDRWSFGTVQDGEGRYGPLRDQYHAYGLFSFLWERLDPLSLRPTENPELGKLSETFEMGTPPSPITLSELLENAWYTIKVSQLARRKPLETVALDRRDFRDVQSTKRLRWKFRPLKMPTHADTLVVPDVLQCMGLLIAFFESVWHQLGADEDGAVHGPIILTSEFTNDECLVVKLRYLAQHRLFTPVAKWKSEEKYRLDWRDINAIISEFPKRSALNCREDNGMREVEIKFEIADPSTGSENQNTMPVEETASD